MNGISIKEKMCGINPKNKIRKRELYHLINPKDICGFNKKKVLKFKN